eukprot:gene3660-8329_t
MNIPMLSSRHTQNMQCNNQTNKQAQLALLQQYIQRLEVGQSDSPRYKYAFFGHIQSTNLSMEGPIEPNKESVPEKPVGLPGSFQWCSVDVQSDQELNELYNLLYQNYVEDDDNMFRALTPPGWKKSWHLGIRSTSKNALVAFISAIPAKLCCKGTIVDMVEINFLCVHKKLRSKRVAPSLISEITRLVNREGIFQAAYTAGTVIPRPIATCQYWHRPLNPKKLIDIRFSTLRPNEKMKDLIKKFKLPLESKHNLVPLQPKHLGSAHELLTNYLSKFKVAPQFTLDDFSHWFSPRENVINSYVLEDESGNVTDLCSFYTLPSTIVQHEEHDELKAAYSFYNVATTMPLHELLHDTLIMAKIHNFDVFNALHIMENRTTFEHCKFGPGDGNLHYYLYNFRLYPVTPEEMGLVLL